MKKISILIILTTYTLFSKTISTFDSIKYIGAEKIVCGKVYGTFYGKNINGEPTFLNLDGNYPNQNFTIVIWGENRINFNRPEIIYKNKTICVIGVIELYKNKPQIVAKSRKQIKIIN